MRQRGRQDLKVEIRKLREKVGQLVERDSLAERVRSLSLSAHKALVQQGHPRASLRRHCRAPFSTGVVPISLLSKKLLPPQSRNGSYSLHQRAANAAADSASHV